jgi:multidrug efflux pump subunit AcrB
MWIVRVALQRPYTFIMLAVLIVFLGIYSILKTPTDIFPDIKIPIAAVIWRYTGLLPEEMAERIVLFSERTAQTVVNNVEHTESQSVNSEAVVKYFFQPKANQDLSLAQIIAVSQTQLQSAPPGTNPPFVLSYNASSVPILQLALSSETIPEQEIFDLGNNILRTQLATVAGASIPYPYGGKQRQVQVDLDPRQLRARGLAASDVVNAIGAQNLILPAGTEKIDTREYFVKLNASPTQIDELNDLPIRARNGGVLYVRDVAHVRDGYPPQTNIARVDGKRAIVMSVLKTGNASTLDIIDGINSKLPAVRSTMPPDLKLVALSDQSVFVRAAISGVIREGIIAAALTGLLILLFLGSWRSTLIITISIPLSILASVACLSALGETINIMTLGGLALSVGILVDDATVTIENINYHLEQGAEVEQAILDGAHQIALPALVSTLSICIVFVPMFQLAGIAKYLFIHPVADADSHARQVLAQKEGRGAGRAKRPAGALPGAVRARFRAHARRLSRAPRPGDRRRPQIRGNIPAGHGGNRAAGVSDRSVARARSGLFSVRGRRPAQAPLAGEHRNAHRGHRRSLRRGRKAHPRDRTPGRDHLHRGQSRSSVQRHQSRVQHLRAGWAWRRGHFHQPGQEAPFPG